MARASSAGNLTKPNQSLTVHMLIIRSEKIDYSEFFHTLLKMGLVFSFFELLIPLQKVRSGPIRTLD